MPPTTLTTAPPLLDNDRKGLLLGLSAVALFSLTLPFTRLAVAELPAIFVALGRALWPPAWRHCGCGIRKPHCRAASNGCRWLWWPVAAWSVFRC